MGNPELTLYRAAIGQILADAGINRGTIQEMVRQMIAEKVDKQFQYIAAHEVNTYSFKNKINDIFAAAIRSAVRDELKNISISVVAESNHQKEDDGCVRISDNVIKRKRLEYKESLLKYYRDGHSVMEAMMAEYEGFMDCLICLDLMNEEDFALYLDQFREELKS